MIEVSTEHEYFSVVGCIILRANEQPSDYQDMTLLKVTESTVHEPA